MDVRVVALAAGKLAEHAADALVWVVSEDTAGQAESAALKALLKQSIDAGDLAWKAGRTICLHRPAQVAAKRLVIAVASGGSAKAVKAAVVAAFGQIKQLGVKQVAVAGSMPLDDTHAEAIAAAAFDAVYVYTHTRPSAPAAPLLAKLSLVVDKALVKPAQAGLRRGAGHSPC